MKTQIILKEIDKCMVVEHDVPLLLKTGDIIQLDIPEPIDKKIKQHNKKDFTILHLIKI